jgi:hypothetical protein
MPTPISPNPISFSNITNEFGTPPGRNLGAFRVSQNVGTLSNLPLDVGVPQSGTIRFSDFFNKRLNIIINYTGISDNSTRLNARSTYNSNSGVVVIGGFRGRPASPENIRLIINLNTRIGSAKGSITNVAFRTGNWRDSNGNALSSVRLDLQSSSKIYGSGGDGGNANAGNGSNGTSAVGIDYPTEVINRGRIQCGAGGGGAGAYIYTVVATGKKGKGNVASYSTGGGGGAGAGFPFGNGGTSVGGAYGFGSNGSSGSGSSYESAGAGGAGGNSAGAGGAGGQFGSGSNGGNTGSQTGGSGGSAGFAFVISSSGSIVSLINTGTIVGSTATGTDPT